MRILLIDDHPVVRHGVRTLLETDPDMQVVGATADPAEAVALAASQHPDVILLDLHLADGESGIDLIPRLRAVGDARIVMFTAFGSDAAVRNAISAGAVGFVLKDAPASQIFLAVRTANAGASTLTPGLARTLARRVRGAETALTPREIDVLSLLAEGLSNRELSARLFVSEATVKTHLKHIFRKLGADGRVSAVTIAAKAGYVHLG